MIEEQEYNEIITAVLQPKKSHKCLLISGKSYTIISKIS